MGLIESFLLAIDRGWKPLGCEPILLQVIGSAALMLQFKYERGTKDGDVLEWRDGHFAIKERILQLAGPNTPIHKQQRVYIDVVNDSILFLPQRPNFHPVEINGLKHFQVEALDVNDVVLSKLKRFNANDINDISAMVKLGAIDHPTLVKRFEQALDWFTMEARSDDLPKYVRNLNQVERDILVVNPSLVELPED